MEIIYILIGLLVTFIFYKVGVMNGERQNRSFSNYAAVEPHEYPSENQDKLIFLNKLLFEISDGIHNIGDKSIKKSGKRITTAEYHKQLRLFFVQIRLLSRLLMEGEDFTEKEYGEIINFIKNDFGNFCHYLEDELDVEKFEKLLKSKI